MPKLLICEECGETFYAYDWIEHPDRDKKLCYDCNLDRRIEQGDKAAKAIKELFG